MKKWPLNTWQNHDVSCIVYSCFGKSVARRAVPLFSLGSSFWWNPSLCLHNSGYLENRQSSLLLSVHHLNGGFRNSGQHFIVNALVFTWACSSKINTKQNRYQLKRHKRWICIGFENVMGAFKKGMSPPAQSHQFTKGHKRVPIRPIIWKR